MAHKITLIPGDGIGLELTRAVTRIVDCAGVKIDREVVEAVHGSAPDIAGQNIANPSALLLAAVMMLEYIEEKEAAMRIENALAEVIEKGEKVTKDINPKNFVGTAEFADSVIEEL